MRLVMPALFIRLPAMMKNGTASSGKLSMPLIIRCTTTNGGMSPVSRMYTSADAAMAMATGTPVDIIARNETSRAGVIGRVLPRRGAWRMRRSRHRLLDGDLGALEQAVAAAPVLDGHLRCAHRAQREAGAADAVHQVHRQVDDRHLVVAHLLHQLPRQHRGVREEG